MVNGNCAVVGCKNSNYRLTAWKETLCEIHAGCQHKSCSWNNRSGCSNFQAS